MRRWSLTNTNSVFNAYNSITLYNALKLCEHKQKQFVMPRIPRISDWEEFLGPRYSFNFVHSFYFTVTWWLVLNAYNSVTLYNALKLCILIQAICDATNTWNCWLVRVAHYATETPVRSHQLVQHEFCKVWYVIVHKFQVARVGSYFVNDPANFDGISIRKLTCYKDGI